MVKKVVKKPKKFVMGPKKDVGYEKSGNEVCDYVVEEFEKKLDEMGYDDALSIFTMGTYGSKAFGTHSDIDFMVVVEGKKWLDKDIRRKEYLEDLANEYEKAIRKKYGKKVKIWLDSLDNYRNPEKFRSATPSDKYENDGRRGLANLVTLHYMATSLNYLYGKKHTSDTGDKEYSGRKFFENLKNHECLKKVDSYTLKKEGIELFAVALRDLERGIFKKPEEGDEEDFRNKYVSKAILNAMYSNALTSGVGFLKPYDEIKEIGDFMLENVDIYHNIVEKAYKIKTTKDFEKLKEKGEIFDFNDKNTIEGVREFFNIIWMKNANSAKEINYSLDEKQKEKFENYLSLTAPEIIEDMTNNFDDRFAALATLYVEDVLGYCGTIEELKDIGKGVTTSKLITLLEKFDRETRTVEPEPPLENLVFRGRIKLELANIYKSEGNEREFKEYNKMAEEKLKECEEKLKILKEQGGGTSSDEKEQHSRYIVDDFEYIINRELGKVFLNNGSEEAAKDYFEMALNTNPFDSRLWSYFGKEAQDIINFLENQESRDINVFKLKKNDYVNLFVNSWYDSLKRMLSNENRIWTKRKEDKIDNLSFYVQNINNDNASYLHYAALSAVLKNEINAINDILDFQKDMAEQLEKVKNSYQIFDDIKYLYINKRDFSQKKLNELEKIRRTSIDKEFRKKENDIFKAAENGGDRKDIEKQFLEIGKLRRCKDKDTEEYRSYLAKRENAYQKYSEFLEKEER